MRFQIVSLISVGLYFVCNLNYTMSCKRFAYRSSKLTSANIVNERVVIYILSFHHYNRGRIRSAKINN